MKKLLILLFTPLICLSQGDFRKMNWGESSKILKEKYSDIIFQKEIQDEITILSCEETVSGIQTTVAYSFTGDKFFAGVYLFGFDSDSKESIDLSKVLAEINNNFVNTQKNNKDKLSNEGFDGLIFKLNQNNKSLSFVSAKTPLFIKREIGKVVEYSGTRKTVGYK